MFSPLNIQMVHGYSVHLFEQNDPALRWKATATNGHSYEFGVGIDAEMALRNLAAKIGINAGDLLRAFGLLT